MNNTVYKKRTRLKDFEYKGRCRYFVTICTHDKKPVFNNDKALITWLIDALKEKAASSSFGIWAYCFMPDHLHLLIEGKGDDSDMKRFISLYKQHTSYYYKKETGLPLWQINYYEHVLRREEETLGTVKYIFNNPVRKRLVGDYREYEFLGSFEFDSMSLL